VLGGQVVAEINSAGGWTRGHVYVGAQALAVQEENAVSWVHEDPVTKTRKRTDAAGTVTSTTLVDPWGGEVTGVWVQSPTQQQKKFTSYERDANNRDEAQQRSYSAWFSRFDQPDPWDGSYDLSDPQSLNRYAYTRGDPVNFVDPTGLNLEAPGGRSRPKPLDGFGVFSPGMHTRYVMGRYVDGIRRGQTVVLGRYFVNFGGVGGGAGGGEGGDGGGTPGTSQGASQPQPCPPTGAELIVDPITLGAIEGAFNASQYGTSNAHEELGLIYADKYNVVRSILRVAPGPPISSGKAGGTFPTTSPHIEGLRLVAIYHTHPYKKGTRIPGTQYVTGDPSRPSTEDLDSADYFNVPGLIGYKDSRGRFKVSAHGPNRGVCSLP
jgi:RHS repeat-associated protein